MMLIELTQVPDAALPVAEFRNHLQIGSGFADDGSQDAVLAPLLRAAIAAVEGECGKALYARTFQFVVTAWRGIARQSLPVAPASAIQSVTVTDMGGGEEVIATSAYRLVRDTHLPELKSAGWALPTIPVGGTAEIVFDAGFGAAWPDVPPALAQAVMMVAAHYYENRSATVDRAKALPLGVESLIRPYRPIRLFGRRE